MTDLLAKTLGLSVRRVSWVPWSEASPMIGHWVNWFPSTGPNWSPG